MKKSFAALLALLLLLSSALAESAVPSPQQSAAQDGGSMTLTVDGKTVELGYDSDPEYSNIMNGSVQASFYAETADGTMYEAYILFPETVQSGDTVTTQSSIQAGQNDPGVMMFITSSTQEIYAAAFQYSSAAYPAGSQYSIRFDSVAPSGSVCAYQGSLTATLMVIDGMYNPQYPLEVSGSFDFTFDMNSQYTPRQPSPSEATPAPEATPNPFAPAQPEATPAPGQSEPEPFIPYAPSVPKNTPSLITPADAKKI